MRFQKFQVHTRGFKGFLRSFRCPRSSHGRSSKFQERCKGFSNDFMSVQGYRRDFQKDQGRSKGLQVLSEELQGRFTGFREFSGAFQGCSRGLSGLQSCLEELQKISRAPSG